MEYDDSYLSMRETWRDWRIEARLLAKLAGVRQDARVLEIGCGGGGLLRQLVGRCACAVGVETSKEALKVARESSERGRPVDSPSRSKRLPLLVQVGEDGALPFAAGTFDAVVGQHVFEHLTDGAAALCEYRRVLQSGGRLALATPNALYPDPAHFADADHQHLYSPFELAAAVARAGFVVESCSTVFPFLSSQRWLRRVGVGAYPVFQHLPFFSDHGRTIVLGAAKRES